MTFNPLHFGRWLLLGTLLALSAQFAVANDTPLVSGSYQILKNKDLGSQSQIQLRIHLVNHGASDFSIQRMTLQNFARAAKGGTTACTVALPAHASAETTQQFIIQRSDYQSWQKGLRPRLVLQIAGPGRTRGKTIVRLDRISSREVE